MESSSSLRTSMTFALIFGLLGAISNASAQTSTDSRLAYERNTIEVAERVSPSVVSIKITGLNGRPINARGRHSIGGSGFVIDEEGRIVTNFHVVAQALRGIEDGQINLAEGARILVSYLGNPEEDHAVSVIGANPDVDLALLQLDEPADAPTVPAIPLADSDEVAVGEKAIVIGNPFGLHSTLTVGVVSAVERERPGLAGIDIPYIQTDAAINPGNSGGPVLNSEGKLTAISNAILAPAGTFAGIGLAVPSNLLRDNLDELRAGGLSGVAVAAIGLAERPRLGLEIGLSVDNYPPPVKSELNMPDQGVVVTSVAEGGPAEQAGIRGPQESISKGPFEFPTGMDVITAIEGQPVRRAIDLQRVVLQHEEGDELTLDVWRDGETREVAVRLEVVPVGG